MTNLLLPGNISVPISAIRYVEVFRTRVAFGVGPYRYRVTCTSEDEARELAARIGEGIAMNGTGEI